MLRVIARDFKLRTKSGVGYNRDELGGLRVHRRSQNQHNVEINSRALHPNSWRSQINKSEGRDLWARTLQRALWYFSTYLPCFKAKSLNMNSTLKPYLNIFTFLNNWIGGYFFQMYSTSNKKNFLLIWISFLLEPSGEPEETGSILALVLHFRVLPSNWGFFSYRKVKWTFQTTI